MRISDWSSDVCSSDLPLPPQATLWHAHEMLFGFAAALIAGFALTAVENWTHAKSVSPGALAALTVLWVTARLRGLLPTPGGQLFAAAVDCLFLHPVALLLRSEDRRLGKEWVITCISRG